MNINPNNDEWIYFSGEYTFLKNRELDNLPRFKTFEEFWNEFNRNSFLVSNDNEFIKTLKSNALEIYNIYNKGLQNA